MRVIPSLSPRGFAPCLGNQARGSRHSCVASLKPRFAASGPHFRSQGRAFLPWPVLEPDSKGLRPREAPDGELEASECDEGRESVSEVLVVLGQTAVSAEPRKGPFDDPATRQHDKS